MTDFVKYITKLEHMSEFMAIWKLGFFYFQNISSWCDFSDLAFCCFFWFVFFLIYSKLKLTMFPVHHCFPGWLSIYDNKEETQIG